MHYSMIKASLLLRFWDCRNRDIHRDKFSRYLQSSMIKVQKWFGGVLAIVNSSFIKFQFLFHLVNHPWWLPFLYPISAMQFCILLWISDIIIYITTMFTPFLHASHRVYVLYTQEHLSQSGIVCSLCCVCVVFPM